MARKEAIEKMKCKCQICNYVGEIIESTDLICVPCYDKLEAKLKEKTIALANELDDCKPHSGAMQMRQNLETQLKAKDELLFAYESVRAPKPKCKTCGDTGKIKLNCSDNRQGFMVSEISKETVPCPDCKAKQS